MLATAIQLSWQQVPDLVEELVEKHADAAGDIRDALANLPQDGFQDLWRHNNSDHVLLRVMDWCDHVPAYRKALLPIAEDLDVRYQLNESLPRPGDDWTKVASRPVFELPHVVKEAASAILQGMGQAAGYLPGGLSQYIPGTPSPLAGTLAGGVLGAGLGYGAGMLGEQLLPRTWRRGKLRRSLAVAGGMAGAAPGLAMLADNYRTGRDWNSDALQSQGLDQIERYQPSHPSFDPQLQSVPVDYMPPVVKQALYGNPFNSLAPPIPLDAFNHIIYHDPYVSSQLSPPQQAAASGLLEAAHSSKPQPGVRWVHPVDIARVSAGMGAGYLAGALVGKALGGLMGMPESTQQHLKQTGMWAGLVSNLIPLAYGAR